MCYNPTCDYHVCVKVREGALGRIDAYVKKWVGYKTANPASDLIYMHEQAQQLITKLNDKLKRLERLESALETISEYFKE